MTIGKMCREGAYVNDNSCNRGRLLCLHASVIHRPSSVLRPKIRANENKLGCLHVSAIRRP